MYTFVYISLTILLLLGVALFYRKSQKLLKDLKDSSSD